MMKKVFAAFLAALQLMALCACTQQGSLSRGNQRSGSESSFSVASQQVSSSSSSSSAAPVLYEDVTIDDVTKMDEVFTDDFEANLWDEYDHEAKNASSEQNWAEQIRNDGDLKTLASKNPGLVNSDITWYLCNQIFDSAQNSYLSLDYVEILVGFDATFARKTGEFFDEIYQEQAQRLYTVFESEMGGYIYCFFNYYPKSDFTALKATVYCTEGLQHADFSQLQSGDSLDRVIEITSTALNLEKNKDFYNVFYTMNWLTDGVVFIWYDSELKITEINYSNNFILPNVFKYGKGDAANSAPYNLYDFTILPQDYPQ